LEPNEELDDWDDEVPEDPVWNEHKDIEYPSKEPNQSKGDWPDDIVEDEVWNEHDEPDEEVNDWDQDLKEHSDNEHL